MNLCFFTDTFFPLVGGAEMVLHNLAIRLVKSERVHVIAPRVRNAENRMNVPYHVHRYGKPSSKRFLVRQLLIKLAWLHARYRFDVIHCHSAYPPAFVAATFKRWTGIPFVVRPHGSDVVPGGRIRKNHRLETRLIKALSSADAVVAQGKYLKDIIVGLGVEKERVHIINNGVDLEMFSKGESFFHPRPYILGLGNLIPRKGFDILLKAYARLRDPEPDLLIAGPGPEKAHLELLTAELGIGDRVHFIGFIEGQEKVNLYRSAEFFVCPSRNEPFANVILEALASGLPVVASAVDGNKELVKREKNGLLFPPGDVGALASCLEIMIDNGSLSKKLREAVPDFIKEFDWGAVAGRYLTLYGHLKGANLSAGPRL
jgi:glycosyltransferase involved in cell wall biosynthesis